MKKAKSHMISRPSDERDDVSETEIATRVTRYTGFENVKHNERGLDIRDRMGRNKKYYQIIARWCKHDVVILHTKTDGGTVVPYTYNDLGERTIHHMEECGWIGNTQRGQKCICLIYDGIHYNALKLNDEQVQPENDTFDMRSDKKRKRKRKCNTSVAANTTHRNYASQCHRR